MLKRDSDEKDTPKAKLWVPLVKDGESKASTTTGLLARGGKRRK